MGAGQITPRLFRFRFLPPPTPDPMDQLNAFIRGYRAQPIIAGETVTAI